MDLTDQKKLANHIIRLLKVRTVSFPIGTTDKGLLSLKYTEGQEEYEIVLDAVPLQTESIVNDENNIELKAMLEKYLFNNEN